MKTTDLILISAPEPAMDMAACCNSFFDAGLQQLHLRFPNGTATAYSALLEQIEPRWLNRVVLPYDCLASGVAAAFDCRRLQIREALRLSLPLEQLLALRQAGYRLGTSVHTVAAYAALPRGVFEYSFLGPVFDSISKPGYPAMDRTELATLQRRTDMRLIALGGINAANAAAVLGMGFDGLGILGCVWQSADPLASFKKVQQCSMTGR